ncbi:MAG TPA: M1 family aminopeptidase [Candidatus Limnocylindrales bacterium]|nr:M1 family aminopeptidase [Candidatus Limnocylindrales bacterium]
MPLRDPLYHPLFLGRRAAPETPPFEPFPPSGRRPWKGEPRPRRDLEFHVRHYKVTLEIDLQKKELRGRAALTIEAICEGLRDVQLDAAELDIAKVSAGARAARHESVGETLRVRLPRPLRAGQRTTIEIAYSTRPRKGFFFVGPTEAEGDRHAAGWSQGQADDTHWWIPCLESTESRATLEMIVTVPQGYRAIGNGRLISRRVSARRKTVTYHWRQDTVHPAYLISLVVGKFVELRDRAGKVPLHGYVPRGSEAKGRDLFRKTPFMIETFSKVFGYPYPYPKYAQSTVVDFTFGGMENTGATTLTVRALQTPEEAIDQTYETLISHELAHQWWGDLVTCRDWSEGWLNEGFATYSEIVFWEAEHGRDEADFARLEQMCSYLVEDYGDYRRPIVETRFRYPSDVFDRHLYEKGACVVHMLRSTLGDSVWRRSLKRYLERHAFSGVETSDLRRACEEESGKNLTWFFDQWLHRGGHPEIKVSREWDADSKSLLLTVEQVQEPDAVTPAVFRIPTVLELAVGNRRLRLPIDIQQRKETIQIALPAQPRYVALDPEHDVMKLMEFPRSDEELLYGMSRSPFALERIRCARELSSHANHAVITALFRTARKDRFWGVRIAALASLGEIGARHPGLVGRIADTAKGQEPRVRRAAAWALGWIGGDDALKILRRIVTTEESNYNVGVALLGIARGKREDAFDTLRSQLGRETHRDLLRQLIFDGMVSLKDPRAVPVLLDFTRLEYRNEAREAATKALGKLGIADERVETRLVELLRDSWFRVRTAAARSLAKLKAGRAEAAIRDALKDEPMDGVQSAFEGALDELKGAR